MKTETAKPKTKMKQPPYEVLAVEATAALRDALGADAVIATNRGYRGRVQIDLISPRLNSLRERQKQDVLWQILDEALGEKTIWISFVLGYGTDENHPTLEYGAGEPRPQQTL